MLKVTCAVIEMDGRILIARRKQGDHLAHKWEFPGGKIEPHETPEQCLKRELMEEFGIEVQIGNYIGNSIYTYKHASIELLAFEAVHVSGEFTLRDHQEIRWISPEELDWFDFAEADIPIARHVMKLFTP